MMTEPTSFSQYSIKSSIFNFMEKIFSQCGLVLALIGITLFFQFMTNGILFRPINLTNLILQNSYIVVMALGMLLVIVSGHIDLSVGSVAGFIGALAAVIMVDYDVSPYITMPLCILIGGIIGGTHGFWIAYLNIPSFIVTLSGMLIYKGLTLWLLSGRSVGPFPVEFQVLSSGFIPDPFNSMLIGSTQYHVTTLLFSFITLLLFLYYSNKKRKRSILLNEQEDGVFLFIVKNTFLVGIALYLTFLLASYKGIPNVFIIMIALITFFVFITRLTTFGRRIYAIGGNQKAARLSGVKTKPLTCLVFVIMGMMSALAGLIFAARLNMATPKAGLGMELDVIAAVFIGGASAMGGIGHATGAVIGAFIMGVMNNGMSIIGINIDWQQVIKGLVLLGAVGFDVHNKKRN